jgi:D-sedoheptulose 7-phosphate isomerase
LNSGKILIRDIEESIDLHKQLLLDDEIEKLFTKISKDCASSINLGHPIFFAGNGGSFANAQHLAAEFTGKMGRSRNSLPAIALGTNSSSMSAIGNDFGFEYTFSREFQALRQRSSVVIALSTSGMSENIINLVLSANELQNPVYAITGGGSGALSKLCPVIKIPTERTERIQEFEILVGHSLCYAIEELLGIFN